MTSTGLRFYTAVIALICGAAIVWSIHQNTLASSWRADSRSWHTVAASTVAHDRLTNIKMADLVARYNRLSTAQKRQADVILARPTDGNSDPQGDGYSVPEHSPADCGPNICIHWVSTTADGPAATDANTNGIPDYVETALTVAENVWNTEVGTMGYRTPLSDSTSANDGGDSKLDIYLADLGTQGLYGYCTTDDPHASSVSYLYGDMSAYCVVDNDFVKAQFPYGANGVNALKVTLAHEFFHAVQFAYNTFADNWLMEGTAAWMEDEVYTSINDNRQYLATSALAGPAIPLDSPLLVSGCHCFWYGSWIWFRFLSEHYGTPGHQNTTLIRSIWEKQSDTGFPRWPRRCRSVTCSGCSPPGTATPRSTTARARPTRVPPARAPSCCSRPSATPAGTTSSSRT